MDKLLIEGTQKMPAVNFDHTTGKLVLTGRSIPEFPLDFYSQLYEWVDQYTQDPAEETQLMVYLDYFNTTSSECLLDLFRRLETIKTNSKGEANICWKYDEDDETMMDSGEVFKSMLSIDFKLVEMDSDR